MTDPTIATMRGAAYELHAIRLIAPYRGPGWLIAYAPNSQWLTGDHAADELRGIPFEIADTDIRGWELANVVIAAYPHGTEADAVSYLASVTPRGQLERDPVMTTGHTTRIVPETPKESPPMSQPAVDQFVFIAVRYTRDAATQGYADEVTSALDALENALAPAGWDPIGDWGLTSRAFGRSDPDSGTERVSFAIMP